MRDILAITNALADQSRIRALLALRGGELCVCQIVELLQLAPSTVSKHLSILKQAGLVETRKEARWMYYSIPEKPDAAVKGVMQWLQAAVAKDAQMTEDQKRLKAILKENPEDICRRQMGKTCCPPGQSCS